MGALTSCEYALERQKKQEQTTTRKKQLIDRGVYAFFIS